MVLNTRLVECKAENVQTVYPFKNPDATSLISIVPQIWSSEITGEGCADDSKPAPADEISRANDGQLCPGLRLKGSLSTDHEQKEEQFNSSSEIIAF